MTEPRSVRWRRRAQTIPTMLAATALALAAVPAALPVLAVGDLLRGRRRMPSVRVYLFALQYLVNDSIEILAAGPYWLLAGFGTRLRSTTSIERHRRLQQWSMDLLERRAQQLLGLRVEIAPQDEAELVEPGGSGPVIVISRHVSLFDASLPGLLYQRAGYATRGIIMTELLADPGFDLLYGRLGSVFIPRDGGTAATAAIDRMVRGAEANTAYVLFPEGRLFRPDVLERAIGRLNESDPARAERLSGLSALLPPRPGGLLTLLNALPGADVVLVDHRGLDRYRHLRDLVRATSADSPITVTARRIPRDDIPNGATAQIQWLDELWTSLDAEVSSSTGDYPASGTP